jgi:hypothetical protein
MRSNLTHTQNDIGRIRVLAEQVAEIAHEPRMEAIKKRWADVNGLRKPDRAPVWCRPVGCWKEMITDDMLICTEPSLRELEYRFLQIIHKRDIDDDEPVEGYFAIDAVFRVEPQNIWGVDINRHESGQDGGAWGYDPPLKNHKDLDKLKMPTFIYCKGETEIRRVQVEEIIGDILPVRVTADAPLSATLGTALAELRGLEQMMMDMLAEPGLIHRLMAYLRDAALSAMDQVEASGILSANNHGPMTCSDAIGSSDTKVTYKNLWCMANSQEFDQVSPAMWEEFCLNYQKPLFDRFGYVGYGCCENLTHKINGVLSIPNLRIFTCSAWTDLTKVMDAVGQNYCIMWRQKASDVVFPEDGAQIRKDLMEGARKLEGHYYQIVLRELQTLAGNTNRLHEWTRFAKEAADKYS